MNNACAVFDSKFENPGSIVSEELRAEKLDQVVRITYHTILFSCAVLSHYFHKKMAIKKEGVSFHFDKQYTMIDERKKTNPL